MSSNPLMMGYEGGDLPLTGVAGQRSGRRPGRCVQAVGGAAWLAGASGTVTRAH